MATEMKALGLSVVIVFMLLQSSQSQSCHKTDQEDYGCPFQQFSSTETLCVAESYNEPGFAFYIKPGNNFNGLIIRLTKTDSLTGKNVLWNFNFSVVKDLLSTADKWYHIQLKSTNSWWSNKHYHLYIDGQEKLTTDRSLAQPSKFILFVNGSPFYSNGTCNPADFPAPPVTTPLPPATSLATETQLIFGKPWWIFVIIGVSFTIIIILIITAVVLIRKWKGKKIDETGGDKEEKGTIKMTTNNNDWQTQVPPPPPPQNFCESDDPANHIYEEPQDFNVEEHIYESMEDIRGPITFVDGNGGQSMAYHVATPERCNIPNQPNNAWQTRRGSAHDSENSLYGYI